MNENDTSCEARIDEELKRELRRIREALEETTLYNMRCLECHEEWRADDDTAECIACGSSEVESVEVEREETRESYEEGILEISHLYTRHRIGLSWGGPADGFYVDIDEDGDIISITYYYSDWFDGAERMLHGKDFEAAREMFGGFFEPS